MFPAPGRTLGTRPRSDVEALLGTLIIALAVAAYGLIFRRTDDALHPLGVFVLFWLGVFGFAHFSVPRTYDEPYYADPFAAPTYLVVVGALATFAFGFWLADPVGRRLDRAHIGWRFEEGIHWGRLRVVTVALFLVATAMTVYFVARLGEIPLLSPRIDQLRTEFKLPLLGYVYEQRLERTGS